MKTILSLLLVLVIVAGCIGMVACGGEEPAGEEETALPTGEEEEVVPPTTEEEEEVTAPSGGSVTWDDMPVYPGAKQIQKGSWAIPPAEEEWSKMEWRYYETSASVSTIAEFYRTNMSDLGWKEVMWMEVEEVSWAFYQKNDEKDGAMIWVGSDNGDTVFALMRGRE